MKIFRNLILKNFVLLILCLSVLFVSVENVRAGSQVVTTKQLKETSVVYNRKREKVFCLKTTPGGIKTTNSKITFTSFATTLSKTSKTRAKTQYTRLQALVKLGTAECKKILAVPTPTPTPIPTATPTGNFDFQGNVTPTGKLLFGIPSALQANITVGKTVFNAKCFGCHVERTGRTFLDIRTNIKQPPMLYDEVQIPDADLANLIAYLNRFRP